MKIGYIGLGAMGGSLARHLLSGNELWVYDLNREAVDAIVASGAVESGSPAEMAAACDLILLCLPRSSDVQALLFGAQGLAEHLRPGMVLVDQTSGVPREASRIAEELAARHVGLVDAPVSGGIPAAREGCVTIFASGPDAAWEVAEPVLGQMSNKVLRCSDCVGDAQALKLINNAIGAGYRIATLETVAMARKAGLAAADMAQLLNAGPAANFTTRHMLPARLAGRTSTNFALALMIKDLNAALDLGLQLDVGMPVTTAARSVMQVGLNTVGKDARLEDMIDLVESMSGSTLTDPPLENETGLDTDDVAAAIVDCVMACNTQVVLECAAVGHNFGLTAGTMNTALNAGSAWSLACESMLGDLCHPDHARQSRTLGEVLQSLKLVARLSARTASPLFVTNVVLAAYEAAAAEFGVDADSNATLCRIAERGAGVSSWNSTKQRSRNDKET